MRTSPAPDLEATLALGVWVQEAARARLFETMGPGFEDRASIAAERAEAAAGWRRDRDLDLPEDLVDGHAAWLEDFTGGEPSFLDYIGDWIATYAADRLGFDLATRPSPSSLRPEMGSWNSRRVSSVIERPPLPDDAGASFAVVVDVHLGSPGAEEALRAIVHDLNSYRPGFVLIAGDLTERGEPEQFEAVRSALDALDVPWFATLGNHDVVRQSTGTPGGADLLADILGAPSQDRVLDCGGMQVVLVDSADPTTLTFPVPTGPDGEVRQTVIGVIGGLCDPQRAQAIADSTDPSRPVVIVSHHQLHPYLGFPPILGGMYPEHSDRLLEVLGDHDVRGALVGHTHRCSVTRVGKARIPQLELPPAGRWPFCYALVHDTAAGPSVVVRQISDTDLVQRVSGAEVSDRWVFGSTSTLRHTFEQIAW